MPGCILVGALFLAVDGLLLAVPSHSGEKESDISGVSSYKDTNVIKLGPNLKTSFSLNYFLIPNTITVRISVLAYELGEISFSS